MKRKVYFTMFFMSYFLFLSNLANAQHHGGDRYDPWNDCAVCHGADLTGAVFGTLWAPSCFTCHNDFSYPDPPLSGHHGGDRYDPLNECAVCHGADLTGAIFGTLLAPSCFTCHDQLWSYPPVAEDDAYSTDEDTILNVAAPGVMGNDSDADGDPLTAELDTDVINGVLTLNTDGSFSYDPNSGFFGTDNFTYHADDGLYDSNVATVMITVNAVNNPPVADPNGPYTAVVSDSIQFDGSGSSDIDDTIVAYDWDFGDGNFGSGVSPTHAYAAAGTYTVSLTVTDDGGATDTATTTATMLADSDGDGIPDDLDSDDDNDGILDVDDACPFEDATGQDADGDGCIDKIEDLPQVVEDLNLPQGTENSLKDKINNIQNSIDAGNITTAINQLNAFINQVNALKGKKITDAEADMLIQYATNLINSLSP